MNHFSLGSALALAAALTLFSTSPAAALPLLSEVYYDASGSDDGFVFVEISGQPGASLTGFSIEGVNGTDGSITGTLLLMGQLGSDGLFVVGDLASGGGTSVVGADQLLNFDFQNGPDSVVLRDASGNVVDALGYGSFGPGQSFAGEGSAASDPPAGSSLARHDGWADTDDNAADFGELAVPTPGSAPGVPVPEPSQLGFLIGLLLARPIATRRAWWRTSC
ncbi:MAG: lamin tail domain-containing protein [bacterium]|nr:lamin tail domain-containing protein [bacterium]